MYIDRNTTMKHDTSSFTTILAPDTSEQRWPNLIPGSSPDAVISSECKSRPSWFPVIGKSRKQDCLDNCREAHACRSTRNVNTE